MSNPNGLLSQNICHYLNQGHTLNGFLDISKLNLAKANVLKVFKSQP